MRRALLDLYRAAWKAVALFAYRQWVVPGRPLPLGIPGNRDPDHLCEAYDPRPRHPGDFAECATDGHYLCAGCALRKPEEEECDAAS